MEDLKYNEWINSLAIGQELFLLFIKYVQMAEIPRAESTKRKYKKENDKYLKTILYPNKESYDLAKKEHITHKVQ
ncbi:MAG: hypothetical protein ACP5N2_05540 [Candidatus Nanoarchaeia archaeon]